MEAASAAGRNSLAPGMASPLVDCPPQPQVVMPIVLLGLGGVGRTLVHHILRTRDAAVQSEVRVVVQAVADSKHWVAIWQPEGFTDQDLTAIVEAKAAGQSLGALSTLGATVPLLPQPHKGDFSLFCPPPRREAAVYVDCTSDEALGCFLVQQLPHLGGLVLANKKPVTASLGVYAAVESARRRVRYEVTCGAGLPVLVTLDRMLGAGDDIHRIAGALSGTLGYVMTGLEEGRSLSEVVLAAREAGYTEPDPRDDLAGTDVARKALILARKLGWRLELADISVKSLFPPHLGPDHMSLPQFLEEGLASLDEGMAQRCEAAHKDGKVLRYAATVENNSCRVGLVAVAPETPLGRLRGSDNLVAISSRCYSSSPLVVQGAGAGNDTTAAGVLADILDLQSSWAGATGFRSNFGLQEL